MRLRNVPGARDDHRKSVFHPAARADERKMGRGIQK